MLRRHNRRHPRRHQGRLRRGFTLIEIMVVVLIIGLLATLVAPNVLRALFKGQEAKIKSDLASISTALTLYYGDKHRYPDSLDALAEVDETGTSYLQGNVLPKDPWGNDYYYDPPRSGSADFIVGTYGRDGSLGGEGEDRDISNETIREG